MTAKIKISYFPISNLISLNQIKKNFEGMQKSFQGKKQPPQITGFPYAFAGLHPNYG